MPSWLPKTAACGRPTVRVEDVEPSVCAFAIFLLPESLKTFEAWCKLKDIALVGIVKLLWLPPFDLD